MGVRGRMVARPAGASELGGTVYELAPGASDFNLHAHGGAGLSRLVIGRQDHSWLVLAAALRTRAAQESERATTRPSRSAWWTIVPRTFARRAARSSSITITSTGQPIGPTASRRRTASATRWWRRQSVLTDGRLDRPGSGGCVSLGRLLRRARWGSRCRLRVSSRLRGVLPGRAASRSRPVRGWTLGLRPRVRPRGRSARRRASR